MKKSFYTIPSTWLLPSKWDLFSLFFVLSMVFVIAWVCSSLGGSVDYSNLQSVTQYDHISMNLWNLPRYAADTTVRMFIALFCSFVFSFAIGAWAAKSKRAESVIIPLVDIFQSIPILGFLAITITGFLAVFPYSLWGGTACGDFWTFYRTSMEYDVKFLSIIKDDS